MEISVVISGRINCTRLVVSRGMYCSL